MVVSKVKKPRFINIIGWRANVGGVVYGSDTLVEFSLPENRDPLIKRGLVRRKAIKELVDDIWPVLQKQITVSLQRILTGKDEVDDLVDRTEAEYSDPLKK